MTHLLRAMAVALFVATLAVVALAQNPIPGLPLNSPQIPIPLGSVNPLSEDVHLEIPIASIPQRNNDPLVAKLVYDTVFDANLTAGYISGGGWRFVFGPSKQAYVSWTSTVSPCPDPNYPNGGAYTNGNFYVQDSHGTRHYLADTFYTYDIACNDNNGNPDPNKGSPSSFTAVAQDAGYTISVTNYVQADATDIDGMDVAGDKDTNGNYYPSVPLKDMFNRQEVFLDTGSAAECPPLGASPYWAPSGPTTGHIYVQSSDGSRNTYTINCQKYNLADTGIVPSTGTVWLMSSLVLPDGSTYSFNYDTGTSGNHFGELTSITLPTGGQETFNYTCVGALTGFYQLQCDLNSMSFGGGTWNFSYVKMQNGAITATNVTAPPRYDSASQKYVSDLTAYNGGNGIATSIQYYSGTSSLQKTVSFGPWTGTGSNRFWPVITTLNDTGQSSKIQWQYYNNLQERPSQIQEFDYSATTPTRTTKFSYGIYNKPTSVSVYAGDGTQGSPISQTIYTYDEYSANYCSGVPMLAGITGATNHDDANYGVNWTSRGNVTSISRWVAGSNWITTHRCYDTLGNVTQEVDGTGNLTKYDYSENWADTSCIPSGTITHGYPTTITDALGHRNKTVYYTCTGLTQATQDDNDIAAGRTGTTSTYDFAERPLSVNYPDGGQKSYSYSDTSSPAYSTATELLTSTLSKSTKTIVDSYNRVTQTQLTTDPNGVDLVDTTYDLLGRVASVTNPYRSTSDSTYGITTYAYDALGRTTFIGKPDGSVVTSSYSGNTTTTTDEAGKKRKTQVNSFGRVSFVWEDPSNLNYETDYTYDVLGNIVSVTQKGGTSSSSWRLRSFTYDGLSRLVCAANPEIQSVTCPTAATGPFPPGSVTYTYDSNSNLSVKTAPSPNQPSGGTAKVTTTYTYDALNRLTGKNYSDTYTQNLATPSVTYGYDGVSLTCSGVPVGLSGNYATNGIGRRTATCFAGGSKSWAYDPMGRIHGENAHFMWIVPPYSADVGTYNGISNLSEDTTYDYYLNGDLNTVFYPGPKGPPDYVFDTIENAAGEVVTAQDIDFNVMTNATYTPTGQLATAIIGPSGTYNGSKISNTYNDRLQPVQMSASTYSGTPILNLTYNFNLGNGTTGSDNGDVIQIINGKDNSRTQNFLYDPLNRIWQAYTNGPNWGETYSPNTYAAGTPFSSSNAGIDAWGNLTNISQVTGKTGHENLACASANTSNQLNSCFTYDAAGNMIKNGSATYTYDAENRLIATTAGISYVYDGDGNRVEKCTTGTTPGTCAANATGTFYWLHNGGGTLAESNLGGNWTAAYGLVRGQIMDRVDLPAKVVHYYYPDHLGTTAIVTDAVGNIVKESDYYPYGGEIPIINNDSNRYKFTGKERDTESGLDNSQARFFGSPIGRFLSVDPSNVGADFSDPQSWNAYSYVLNNPLNSTDPDGLRPCAPEDDSCVIATPPPDIDTTISQINTLIVERLNQAGQDAANALQQILNAVRDWANKPRDPGCMAGTTAAGAGIGTGVGGLVGTSGLALAGGGVLVTEPAGLQLGAAAGASAGYVVGQFVCAKSTGGGGGGGDQKAAESTNQMGEAAAGKGRAIAGAGTNKTLREAARLAKEYGGSPADWRKMATSNAVNKGMDNFEIHYYQNVTTGQVVEMKSVPLSLRQ